MKLGRGNINVELMRKQSRKETVAALKSLGMNEEQQEKALKEIYPEKSEKKKPGPDKDKADSGKKEEK